MDQALPERRLGDTPDGVMDEKGNGGAGGSGVLVLVRDLMFSSRISATARAAGVDVAIFRDPTQLAATPGRRLIVDLNLPGAIEAAAAWMRSPAGRGSAPGGVVGFVSHVDAETIARARAAGIDRVLPRSRFVETLAELLT